jgi:DNA-binding PadR family transcriptional regulator
MGRIFRRGELKEAIVVVLTALGEAHGYAIMNELKERIGGGWKPSPGAIYPALLALVETGHVRTAERDGTRVYSLTDAGRRAAKAVSWAGRWRSPSWLSAERIGKRWVRCSTASRRSRGFVTASPARPRRSRSNRFSLGLPAR